MKRLITLILLVFSSIAFGETSGQIQGASGAYYISTPWDSNDIWNVQFAQADNEMYLVDGNNIPQVLTRSDHNSWTIADVDFQTGPFLAENEFEGNTITPNDVNGTGVTLTFSGTTLFQSTTGASHVGSIWAINQVRETSTVSGSFTANGVSLSSPSFSGDYGFTTTGTWVGTVTLQRSTNNGISWRAALTPLVDTNFDNPAESEESTTVYRVVMSNYTSGTCNYTFTITDNYNKGVVRITAVADGNTATCTVLAELVDTNSTATWREGYWSDYRGWPKTVEFHQQRLIYGGTETYPQTIWFGKADPDDYPNFLEGTLDTSAFTIALQGQNPIRWLKSQDYLIIGTSGSTGKYGDQGKAVTPTSPNYREQAKIGSEPIMAIDASDSLLFIERGGRKVREFAYSLQYDKHLAPDLTLYAEDITEGLIIDTAFQMSPDPTLWCVLADGNMATLTYKRDQEVVGWTLQTTDGDFESVCRIPGLTYEDEIWVVVKRTIDGNDKRYVEKFEPRDWGNDPNDCWFVDSGLTWSGGDGVNISDVNQSDPAKVTVATWPTDVDDANLGDGDQIKIGAVVGMTELNGNVYVIDDADTSTLTFTLNDSTDTDDINSIGYTAYVSGGMVLEVESDFNSIDHLIGEDLSIYADTLIESNEVVDANGEIVIDNSASRVLVGLPFTSKLETLPLRIDPQDKATSKKIERVFFDFFETGYCQYGNGPDATLMNINFKNDLDADPNATRQDLITSVVRFRDCIWPYGPRAKQTIYIESDKPMPLTIRSMTPQYKIIRR